LSVTPSLAPINEGELIFRLSLAVVCGAIIGLEREIKNKPAGLRTNVLVSFGTALFILVTIQTGAAQVNSDVLGRAITGIASGIGFVGGGTILRDTRIRGLTSAAAIWVSAALGIAVGCGLWFMGLVGAIFALLILTVLKKIEPYL
jgi:putative Mg2+ transporter-C (MgtC) family protein